ncbi:enoyl-CoA hydratase/isomerase family protein [Actinophytocola sediminis]
MDTDVTVLRTADWLTVAIDRPAVRNALRTSTLAGLESALDTAERDDEVRAVILTGGPKFFCAGVDLKEVTAADPAHDLVASTARLRRVHRLVDRLRTFPKPTVAAVDGYAIGIGFSLVLACDLVAAGRTAFFAHPSAEAGMLADGALVRDLHRLIGYRRTLELLLRGKRLTAVDAATCGLVNELSEPGESLAAAEAMVREFAAVPPEVLFGLKALAASAAGEDFLAHESTMIALLKRSTSVEARRRFLSGERFFEQ